MIINNRYEQNLGGDGKIVSLVDWANVIGEAIEQ